MTPPRVWIVAVNSSTASSRAYEFLQALLKNSRFKDEVYAYHVYEPSEQASLPASQRADYIRKTYDQLGMEWKMKAAGSQHLKFQAGTVEKKGRHIHQCIADIAKQHTADYIVVGSGRAERKETLGSVAFHLLGVANCAVLCVKTQALHKAPSVMHFMLAVNDSKASEQALEEVSAFVPPHKLTVVNCSLNPKESESVVKSYTKKVADKKIDAEVIGRAIQQARSVGEEICEAADDYDVDLIILGHLSTETMGSVSKYTVKNAQRHVLVIRK